MKRSKMLSNKLTAQISERLPNKTPEELEIINYGIESFIMNIYKFALMIALAYWLNITKMFIFTLCTYGFIRFFASGVHARNWYVCLITSSLALFGIVFISQIAEIPLIIKSVLFLFSLILFWKYSPADTEERPIVNMKKRKFLKLGSILTATGLFVYSFLAPTTVIGNICILSFVVSGLFTTPLIYRLYGKKHNNYKEYLKI